jgi:Sec-independent protein translocase protein TatA
VPGLPDLFTILAILVIVFGATVLPKIGETIGKRLAGARQREEGEASRAAEAPAKPAPPKSAPPTESAPSDR